MAASSLFVLCALLGRDGFFGVNTGLRIEDKRYPASNTAIMVLYRRWAVIQKRHKVVQRSDIQQ